MLYAASWDTPMLCLFILLLISDKGQEKFGWTMLIVAVQSLHLVAASLMDGASQTVIILKM